LFVLLKAIGHELSRQVAALEERVKKLRSEKHNDQSRIAQLTEQVLALQQGHIESEDAIRVQSESQLAERAADISRLRSELQALRAHAESERNALQLEIAQLRVATKVCESPVSCRK